MDKIISQLNGSALSFVLDIAHMWSIYFPDDDDLISDRRDWVLAAERAGL